MSKSPSPPKPPPPPTPPEPLPPNPPPVPPVGLTVAVALSATRHARAELHQRFASHRETAIGFFRWRKQKTQRRLDAD
jgi:hypothetical protein